MPFQGVWPEFRRLIGKVATGLLYVFEMKVVSYEPFRGGCRGTISRWVASTRSVANLQCDDESCLYKLLKDINPRCDQTVKWLKKSNDLNMSGISSPVSLARIDKFERQNPQVAVNVYYAKTVKRKSGLMRSLYPIRVSTNTAGEVVDLLIVPRSGTDDLESRLFGREGRDLVDLNTDEFSKGRKTEYHYCLITNMSRLLRRVRENTHKTHVCRRCLRLFSVKHVYDAHVKDCVNFAAQVVTVPKANANILKFDAYKALLSPWFTCYADFESLLVPTTDSTFQRDDVSSTKTLNTHTPFAYGYTVVNWKGETVVRCKTRVFEDGSHHAGAEFIKELDQLYQTVLKPKMVEVKPLMTSADWASHRAATHCAHCKVQFIANSPTKHKTLHHDHKDGRYLGAYCSADNILIKQTFDLPVLIHNSSNYDNSFLISGLGKVLTPREKKKVKIIPQTREKYIGIKYKDIRFMDSFRFLSTSVEKLAGSLNDSDFSYLSEYFSDDPRGVEKVAMLRRKGIFPYSYLTGYEKLRELGLPPPAAFHNDLTDTDVTESEYQFASEVFQTFGCETLADYVRAYLTSDVLILCCAFQAFRAKSIRFYGLDPTGFWTTPGFAFQAALLMTRAELELMTDPDMMLMIEKSVRGGLSQVTHRYAKSNVPGTPDYDDTKPPLHILYADENNLYGRMQSGPLPTKTFRWMTHEELEKIDPEKLSEQDLIGYVFEADLYVPQDSEYHEKMSDYPLAPVHRKVETSELSKTQLKYPQSKTPSHPKLVLDMHDKLDYVLHGLALKTYSRLGLKYFIKRGIAFEQTCWLKPFIDFNTLQRSLTSDPFERTLYKLMNNATFGKLCESQRRKRDVHLVHDRRRFLNLVSQPNFYDFSVFSTNLVAVEMKRTKIVLDRPLVQGFTVLDLSKEYMVRKYYDVIKPMFNDKVRLAYTDTDAFMLLVSVPDLNAALAPHVKTQFDFSSLPPDHPLYYKGNEMKLGFLKDETNGRRIMEMFCLRSKMYYLSMEDHADKMAAKGCHRSTFFTQATLEHYRHGIFGCGGGEPETAHRVAFHRFLNDKQNISTVRQVKLGISAYDDKRWICKDNIHTFPYGFKGKKSNLAIPL